MYISSLESFGIDKLRDVEMRKKYAAGQQPEESAVSSGTDKVRASAKQSPEAREAAS
jgi:hypothetical protein